MLIIQKISVALLIENEIILYPHIITIYMDSTQVLQPGALLEGGKYRIERVLGQGGFGVTYLATDLNLDRRVCIKEFFPSSLCFRNGSTSHVTLGTESSRDFVERLKAKFLKEARNIAKFDHPGIIRIYAAFEDNNTAYYVMEYIEGQSLSEIVKQHGPLDEAQAIRIIREVGDALEYIHARRINHLDVKPANVMVRYSGEPILIDFGLSKQYDTKGHQTSTTPVGLSHGFAPLEQYKDGGVQEFSPATDIYSLAATLYYVLTGTVPPQAPDLVEQGLSFPPDFPPQLIAPIRRAMSSARRERHDSASAFVSELRTGTTGKPQPIATPLPQKESERTSSEGKSGKMVAVSIVVLLFVLAFGLTTWWLGSRGATDEPPAPSADSVTVEFVTDMKWESPFGMSSYTGQVVSDSVQDSGKKLPHGKGVARVTAGDLKGSLYDGEFVNGRMQGKATYTFDNGDTFEGTFRDNEFYQGRFTIRETGDYFEGTFRDGVPYKGEWHNKNGNITERL